MFFPTSQKLYNIFLPTLIHTFSTSTVCYKEFCFSSSYKNSKNKIYISIGSVHKILLIRHRCTWRWGGVFLTVHVCVSREAWTAHKQRVHGGHFGSNKRMYTVEDGCQVSKLQLLENTSQRQRDKFISTSCSYFKWNFHMERVILLACFSSVLLLHNLVRHWR